MAGKGRQQTARKPAIKFAHLRKKMEKARIGSKIGRKKGAGSRLALGGHDVFTRRSRTASRPPSLTREGPVLDARPADEYSRAVRPLGSPRGGNRTVKSLASYGKKPVPKDVNPGCLG
jgi:hypothetical protein